MAPTNRQTHWEHVYSSKTESEVSWFQTTATPSMELLTRIGATPTSAIIDIGGGASRLVDDLHAQGFENLTVLDLSVAALATARTRLGSHSDKVAWIVADITTWSPPALYDIWHDRAALHFLTQPDEQFAYRERLITALRPGGHAIIGTFAPNGPETCSGLPVIRHTAQSLSGLLGDEFTLVGQQSHDHLTPWSALQKFQFSSFQRRNN